MIKPAYSVSFLLSINIFVWQNVLYFLDAPRTIRTDGQTDIMRLIVTFHNYCEGAYNTTLYHSHLESDTTVPALLCFIALDTKTHF